MPDQNSTGDKVKFCCDKTPSCSKPHQGLFLKRYGAQMLFLLRVYHKVSFLNTCALQYRLALSVSDANVNDHTVLRPKQSGIVSDSNFLWVHRRFDVISAANRYPLVVHPFLKDVGMEEKREGFIF